MFLNFPILETDRLVLRLASRQDAASILEYYSVNKEFLTPLEPARVDGFYTVSFWQDQVDKALVEFNYEQAVKLCVFKKSDPDRVIGKVNFHQMLRGVSHSCVLGYSLAEQEQGQGYMTEALQTGIDYMFTQQHLHRIMANYMPRNQRSGNLLRRLGFVVEGYARDYLLINDRWEDHILTSLTYPNWKH